MDPEVIDTLESLKAQLEKLLSKIERPKKNSSLKRAQEEAFVKELLKSDYIITNNADDMVPCAELCRFLAIQTDRYSPRKLDYILAKMLTTINKKVKGVTTKYKTGIKKTPQCDIE